MLQSQHGNPDMRIAQLAEIRMNAFHLVAEHDANRKIGLPVEQVDCMEACLHGRNLVAGLSQFGGQLVQTLLADLAGEALAIEDGSLRLDVLDRAAAVLDGGRSCRLTEDDLRASVIRHPSSVISHQSSVISPSVTFPPRPRICLSKIFRRESR